jgi:hypothetical protein
MGVAKSSQTSQDFTTIAMDFAFEVSLTALVRVRATDESAARKVVTTVLGAPGTIEIALANEANAATGQDGRVTDVGFSITSLTLINGGGPPCEYESPNRTSSSRSLSSEVIKPSYTNARLRADAKPR